MSFGRNHVVNEEAQSQYHPRHRICIYVLSIFVFSVFVFVSTLEIFSLRGVLCSWREAVTIITPATGFVFMFYLYLYFLYLYLYLPLKYFLWEESCAQWREAVTVITPVTGPIHPTAIQGLKNRHFHSNPMFFEATSFKSEEKSKTVKMSPNSHIRTSDPQFTRRNKILIFC